MALRKLRIVFMGTPEFAVAPLEALLQYGFDVLAVVSSPDKPAGRGMKMRLSAMARFASQGRSVYCPSSFFPGQSPCCSCFPEITPCCLADARIRNLQSACFSSAAIQGRSSNQQGYYERREDNRYHYIFSCRCY